MIWLTWRQSRLAVGAVWAALAGLAAALVLTHGRLVDLYRAAPGDFLAGMNHAENSLFTVASLALLFAPPVVGAFWGAPLLARELEAGTHRLIWNQSVTRVRWLSTKLGLTVAAAAVGAAALSVALTWWAQPIDRAVAAGQSNAGIFTLPRLTRMVFDTRGVVPVAYTMFAVALGLAVGALLRRSVPAMAVTLALVVAVQIALPLWVRPQLIPPAQQTVTITSQNLQGIQMHGPDPQHGTRTLDVSLNRAGDWVLGRKTVNASGATVSAPAWVMQCMPLPGQRSSSAGAEQQQACFDRLAREGYREQMIYQPAARFWQFQWMETAVLGGLALLLTALSFWRLRRVA